MQCVCSVCDERCVCALCCVRLCIGREAAIFPTSSPMTGMNHRKSEPERERKIVIYHPFQFKLIIQTRQITVARNNDFIIGRPSFDSMHTPEPEN